MDLTHIRAFTAAMARKDLDAMLAHMADGSTLHTPLRAEPVRSKAAIRAVVTDLFRVVDCFEFRAIMQGEGHAAAFFTLEAGPHALDGTDVWRLDDSGRIADMRVFWRPLPAALAVQNALLRLADASQAA